MRLARVVLGGLVALGSAADATDVAPVSSASEVRPHYARVDGDIETLWQRPLTSGVRGLVFLAHGCMHQATDFFADREPDGWLFTACAHSNFGRCLGLPEERRLVLRARERGYLVAAVSGGSGRQSCWDMRRDGPRVAAAVRHVLAEERLPADTQVLAMGASSGGAFLGQLLLTDLQPQLRCIAPQISAIRVPSGGSVPTIFVHMSRDERTARMVADNVRQLQRLGVRAAQIEVEPESITADFLKASMPEASAHGVVAALSSAGLLAADGHLKADPRGTVPQWSRAARAAAPQSDSLTPDESPLSEALNVAWAFHEFSSASADEVLDFCEGGSNGVGGGGRGTADMTQHHELL